MYFSSLEGETNRGQKEEREGGIKFEYVWHQMEPDSDTNTSLAVWMQLTCNRGTSHIRQHSGGSDCFPSVSILFIMVPRQQHNLRPQKNVAVSTLTSSKY